MTNAVVVRTEHVPHIIDGTTNAASLGRLDLTCPNDCQRFGGHVPGHIYGSSWDWVPCQTCGGTGQVALPDGPTDLAVIANRELIGTAHGVRYLPVVNHGDDLTGLPDMIELLDGTPKWVVSVDRCVVDISEALPFGPWEPGDTAITWEDFAPFLDFPDGAPDGLNVAYEGCDGTEVVECPIALPDAPTTIGPTTINLGDLT